MLYVYNLPAEQVHNNMFCRFAIWKRLSVNTWKIISQAFLPTLKSWAEANFLYFRMLTSTLSQFYIYREVPEETINGYPGSNKQ